MVDLEYLSKLIVLLRSQSVSTYKEGGLEIGLLPSSNPSPPPAIVPNPQEQDLPPDLRADSLFDQDKILNWSSPDGNHESLPLTGDEPL